MKKIAAFILILAILCSLLTACGEQKSSDASPPQDTSSVEAAAPLESGEWDELTHRLLVWVSHPVRIFLWRSPMGAFISDPIL